jgi:malate dehydrogenase
MKVVIIGGAGGVGSSVAFNLLTGPAPYDIVLVDPRPHMIASHVMDFQQMLPMCAQHSVRGGDAHELSDADVCVISASVPLRLNTSRSTFLQENAGSFKQTVEFLRAISSDWRGIFVIATNPVDALCTWFQRNSGIDRKRILGYTLNDTLRLRSIVAGCLSVHPRDVYAWVIGEHGEHSVPLFNRITVSGAPIMLDDRQRTAVDHQFRSWYARHVALDSGRTTTWTTGLGISKMINAFRNPIAEVWPVSVVLQGEYGIHDASLTVPVVLGIGGVHDIQLWPLEDNECESLKAAASHVRNLCNQLPDLPGVEPTTH